MNVAARPTLPRAGYRAIVATDAALCLLGLAIGFEALPSDIALLDALPPIAGLLLAAFAALGLFGTWYVFGREHRGDRRGGGTVQ